MRFELPRQNVVNSSIDNLPQMRFRQNIFNIIINSHKRRLPLGSTAAWGHKPELVSPVQTAMWVETNCGVMKLGVMLHEYVFGTKDIYKYRYCIHIWGLTILLFWHCLWLCGTSCMFLMICEGSNGDGNVKAIMAMTMAGSGWQQVHVVLRQRSLSAFPGHRHL